MQYTDGLTEAMDSEGNEFGELQLYSSFFAHANLSAQDLVDAIAVDVVSHVQGQLDDDLTIFALSKLPNEDMGGSGEWDGIEQKGWSCAVGGPDWDFFDERMVISIFLMK